MILKSPEFFFKSGWRPPPANKLKLPRMKTRGHRGFPHFWRGFGKFLMKNFAKKLLLAPPTKKKWKGPPKKIISPPPPLMGF